MAVKIAVVGSSNTDMIIKVPRIPKPGETVLGGRFSTASGGKGANQAVAAARAGAEVCFIARVGDDMFAEAALEGFSADGIDISGVRRDPSAPSGVALIFVAEDGENSIAVASGANANLSADDVNTARSTIESADILLTQLETPQESVRAAVKIASDAGVKVILNPAPAQPLDDALMPQLDVLTPNEYEANRLTGIQVSGESSAAAAAAALRRKGVGCVLITLGSRGVYMDGDEKSGLVPAYSVKAVDTTAAGDVFNGTLAVALAEGRTLDESVRFASAAAALSVTKLGAQPSAPSRAEIDKMLSKK